MSEKLLNDYLISEIPKHKKKSRKHNIKSDHKHIYSKCVVKYNKDFGFGPKDQYVECRYCTLCGHIDDIIFFWNHQDELKKSNRCTLPIIDIGNYDVIHLKQIDLDNLVY